MYSDVKATVTKSGEADRSVSEAKVKSEVSSQCWLDN